MPTLDQLRSEVDKEFAPYTIPLPDGTEVTLRNPLRLNSATRSKVQTALKAMTRDEDAEDALDVEDLAELCCEVLRTVGGNGIEALLEEIDGDAALLIHVIQSWDGGHPTGGSLESARLLDEYGEFLVPDMKRVYGMDLRELFLEVPPWSPRFVLWHVNSLDYDSATVAEMRGGSQFRGWDEDRYLLAAISNAVRLQGYMFLMANRDPKKSKPQAPEPWPLPDKEAKKQRQQKPGSFAWIVGAKLAAAKKRKKLKEGGVVGDQSGR